MSTPVKDHTLRTLIMVPCIVIGLMIIIFPYIHYQTSSAIDCSLITPENNIQNPGSNYVNYAGRNITVIEENQKCFDSATIKVYEICYYVSCGQDVNQTVNYQFKEFKHSLADPDKTHLYPSQPSTAYWGTML